MIKNGTIALWVIAGLLLVLVLMVAASGDFAHWWECNSGSTDVYWKFKNCG